MKEKQIQYIEHALLIFNIVSVMSITAFIYITTNKICGEYNASTYLQQVQSIPWNPKELLIVITVLLITLVISYEVRILMSHDKTCYTISLIVDFVVSILIIILLDFNYNGILLWVFASMISYRREGRGVYAMIALGVGTYICTNHTLLGLSYRLFSVKDYISYYDVTVQKYLYGFENLITSISILLFLLFCVCIIITQSGTIEEVKALYKQLSVANEELQEANVKLEEYANIKGKMGETKERNRLAREIHDTLGHTLTGLSAGIDACITMIEYSPESTKEQLNMLSEVARNGIKEVRRSVNELRPDALERLNLEYAITKMIEEMNQLTSTNVDFHCDIENLKFDEDEENTIYRVIQESITNSIRHGHAHNISVNLTKIYSDIHILIKDDGIGCKNPHKGFGLKHIIERVKMLRGKVEFDGSDGFTTKVVIPIRWGEEYD